MIRKMTVQVVLVECAVQECAKQIQGTAFSIQPAGLNQHVMGEVMNTQPQTRGKAAVVNAEYAKTAIVMTIVHYVYQENNAVMANVESARMNASQGTQGALTIWSRNVGMLMDA